MKSVFGNEFMPEMMNEGDAGYDFKCPDNIVIIPNRWTLIDTGIVLEDGDIGKDMFLDLRPRSGFGSKYGFKLRNTVGVIDEKYRNHIMAKVTVEEPNGEMWCKGTERIYWDDTDGDEDIECKIPVFYMPKGTRFMQGIVLQHYYIGGLPHPTGQRKGGFGSTGTR